MVDVCTAVDDSLNCHQVHFLIQRHSFTVSIEEDREEYRGLAMNTTRFKVSSSSARVSKTNQTKKGHSHLS